MRRARLFCMYSIYNTRIMYTVIVIFTQKHFFNHHLSFVVLRSSFIVHRSSFIVYDSSFIVCRSSSIARRSSSITHRSSFIVHRSSFIVHRSSFIVRRSSSIDHRSSSIDHRSSFVNHRSSFIIQRSSFIIHRLIRNNKRCGPHAQRQHRKDPSAMGPAEQSHSNRRYAAQQKHLLCRQRQLDRARRHGYHVGMHHGGGWGGVLSRCAHAIWNRCSRCGCWTGTCFCGSLYNRFPP